MTPAEIRALIERSKWVRARTTTNPHEYTLKTDAADQAAFEAFVVEIRAQGEEIVFAGNVYTCVDVDGYRYWSMGAPVPKTILINRRKLAPGERMLSANEVNERLREYFGGGKHAR
jgi:hypothetical protein